VQLLSIRARGAQDVARQQQLGAESEWLATRLFIPSSLLVLIFGALLVWESEAWKISQMWILLGLTGYAASFLTGIFYFSPEARRIRAAGEAGRVEEVAARTARVEFVSRIELVILFLVVVDMVTKPGL
jgi:uncharacterized membrane protein